MVSIFDFVKLLIVITMVQVNVAGQISRRIVELDLQMLVASQDPTASTFPSFE